MPKERLSMRKIREVLKLKYERGQSGRSIAKSISVSPSTATDYLPLESPGLATLPDDAVKTDG